MSFFSILHFATIENVIEEYNMQPHPEGGYFSVSYESTERIDQDALPHRFTGDRRLSTAIYFLITYSSFSTFHQLKADEGWHFYIGHSVGLHIIQPDGTYSLARLGWDKENGDMFQYYVPAGSWFAAKLINPEYAAYALVGCTVAPGFEFDDFKLGRRSHLLSLFPQHQDLIEELTRD